MDKIIPISDLQSKAKKYVEQVRETDQPVIVTQRGRPSAVLVSYESYEGLLETLDEMSYPDSHERLARARRESAAGKTVSLDDILARRLQAQTDLFEKLSVAQAQSASGKKGISHPDLMAKLRRMSGAR